MQTLRDFCQVAATNDGDEFDSAATEATMAHSLFSGPEELLRAMSSSSKWGGTSSSARVFGGLPTPAGRPVCPGPISHRPWLCRRVATSTTQVLCAQIHRRRQWRKR
mmetsp:Transcript_31621/g.84195  ORF Transcript_31621/g.84195 Transcript_31621/m.84195 type:complete len:107 (+) Transcript_31621:254-574(+)